MNDATLTDLLIQASIKTENRLMNFSDSSQRYCPDTVRSTVSYIIFYQVGPIEHGTHFPGPVDKSIAESDYNEACTTGMSLAYFRMLIREFLNKNPDRVPQQAPLIVQYRNSAIYMANNGKDTKHTRHISRKINFERNGEKCKMHKIYWCEGGLQLAYIATNTVGGKKLTITMKYTMVRLDK